LSLYLIIHCRTQIYNTSSSSAACELTVLGVNAVQVEYRKSEQLDKAFEGATVVFEATDLWVHMEDYSVNSLASVSKARLAAIAYDCEATKGIDIVKAAGRYQTLKHFITSYL